MEKGHTEIVLKIPNEIIDIVNARIKADKNHGMLLETTFVDWIEHGYEIDCKYGGK
jgi:hypothetical protein